MENDSELPNGVERNRTRVSRAHPRDADATARGYSERFSMRILFLGDVVGRPGREAVAAGLPRLRREHKPDFTIVNGENAAGGHGITAPIAEEIFAAGADAITLGNHAFNQKTSYEFLSAGRPIVRPGNFGPNVPGVGSTLLVKGGLRLLVANLCGRVNMEPWYDDPFAAADRLAREAKEQDAALFLDFHAEATSEKVAMGWHLDGRAVAVIGTHTHVPTADERVLPQGTAHQSDAGMCGPRDSVLGSAVEGVLGRFRTPLPRKLEVAAGPAVLMGAIVDADPATKKASRIERLRVE